MTIDTPHNPSLGLLCPCQACIDHAIIDYSAFLRRKAKANASDADYISGDHDLIDTRRRYELGE